MRRFTSYGPVDPQKHFCVERCELVEECVENLVNDGEEGHYFTIWAPRQTGKTWLMRRAIEQVRARFDDRFAIGALSMQGVMRESDGEDVFFRAFPSVYREGFGRDIPAVENWTAWLEQFERERGIFDRPTILLIDEFDSLPQAIIDRVVSLFRKTYQARSAYYVHGLALIGVRAVLGAQSDRGSPFNVQRSQKVENLTQAEVNEIYDLYEEERGQIVEKAVRNALFEATRGQPGLVSWFGELLTEKFNPGRGEPISMATWQHVFPRAIRTEWNNNIVNLLAKAREREPEVMRLFAESDIPFSIHQEWCNYLYLNGVIDYDDTSRQPDDSGLVCRFSSPFVQECLYTAFTEELYGGRGPVLALKPGDALEDVFSEEGLNLPPLLDRYQQYLERVRTGGHDPWRETPRRQDRNIMEAVGHFHLYAWLREAIGNYARINPQFPTGNGLVDLVIHYGDTSGVIEVKSFRNMLQLARGRAQAARYARYLGLDCASVALFVHTTDEGELEQLSGESIVDGIRVVTVAIGWG